jgi:hypothetical protein
MINTIFVSSSYKKKPIYLEIQIIKKYIKEEKKMTRKYYIYIKKKTTFIIIFYLKKKSLKFS